MLIYRDGGCGKGGTNEGEEWLELLSGLLAVRRGAPACPVLSVSDAVQPVAWRAFRSLVL